MADIGTDIDLTKALLQKGELVAIPTETVYGLGANACNEQAVTHIFAVKNRPFFDPLILHFSSIEQIKQYISTMPEKALKLAQEFWPGPLTLVLPKNRKVSDLVSSGLSTVGVRIPNHPLTFSLLRSLDFPVAAPSANPFGYISPTTAAHVDQQLGNQIPYILDGGSCQTGVESTIVGFEEDQVVIYRLGGIGVEEIEKIIGTVRINAHSSSSPKSPGMLQSHYSPRKPLKIYEGEHLNDYYGSAFLGFQHYHPGIHKAHQKILSPSADLKEAAQNLFKYLRILDALDVNCIFAEMVPEHGLGRAINDRLRRASAT